ncbi:tetratricopeptide repeat protein [Candidatus Peribacteria bacterium]|jgi:protein O-mannosyl-transferase|nr:tetratricopeptide repeat protein [Candidatus Peribacteria bacterium]MBT4240611.1 tetratricopeptide repeat protein [Candidatus Peribacteria bacterium]MBT4474617.1 tetratricopeptide repeat protein [Candidatus Peribacteria bacterium]
MKNRRAVIVVIFFLAINLLIYSQSLNNKFVRWDDGLLIYENPIVRNLSVSSVAAAFSTYDPELYIPLTFISYQIDYLVGGVDPFMYHVTNLLLHTLNSLLVFLFAYFLLKNRFAALFCGVLFAVHPLNAEAVVWASARKDLLATFFFLGALVSYLKSTHYSLQTTHRLYVNKLSILCFLLSLLSKVSVIALPLVLLLIDYLKDRKIDRGVILEKIPYFALSIIFGIVAIFGKAEVIEGIGFTDTVIMACRSGIFYISKIFIPTGLSVLYPAGDSISIFDPIYFVPVILVIGLMSSLIYFRKNKLFVFSILFFLINLIPSFTNFAKDGDLYFASDRYAYIPMIGVLILICALLFKFKKKLLHNYSLLIIHCSFLIVICIFAALSFFQSRVWASTESLFTNVIERYPNMSHRAHNNIGNVYRRQDDLDKAIAEFEIALSIKPHPKTYGNLGAVYRKNGDTLKALEQYRKAMELDPENAEPYFGLGLVYAASNDFGNALDNYNRALELDPRYAEAYSNIGALYASRGDYERAVENYLNAIEANSMFIQAYYNLGVSYSQLGKNSEAISAYEGAIEIHPNFVAARLNLGILYYGKKRIDDAVYEFEQVLEIDPNNASARSALGQIGR